MLSVCTFISFINFWMIEPIFMNRVMYIMAHESISTAYSINPSHQFVCIYGYPLIVVRQRLGKTLPLQWIRTQQKKNCWRRRFLRSTCRIKGNKRLILLRTCCIFILTCRTISRQRPKYAYVTIEKVLQELFPMWSAPCLLLRNGSLNTFPQKHAVEQ
jgi:hypothetical protein